MTGRIARLALVAVLAALSLGIPASVSRTQPVPAAPGEAKPPSISTGNTAFALDLYARLREREGNLIVSPLSVSTALTMAYAGARGATATEMETVLHLPPGDTQLHQKTGGILKDLATRKKVTLDIANAMWCQKGYGLRREFRELLQTDYRAELNEVDFARAPGASADAINKWVARKTHDRILQSMPRGALNSDARLVLSNAVYFKGEWATQFEKGQTKDGPFQLADGKTVNVPMMTSREFGFRKIYGDGFEAVELPYSGDELAMWIFVPSRADGLPGFEKSLTADNLTTWLAGASGSGGRISMPRFAMASDLELNRPLCAMGMTRAFDPGQADFSGITDAAGPFFIQRVLHSAFVEVDEKGTVAGAATHVGIGCAAAPSIFFVDRPFLFLLRDRKTGAILFMGRVVNPKG